MAALDSRKKLKEYCLRRLGYDVHEVEISDPQMEDRIDDCINMFKLFHYDGAIEYNYKKTVTWQDAKNGYIVIDNMSTILKVMTANPSDKSNLEVFDDLEWRYMLEYNETPQIGSQFLVDYHITMEHLSTMRRLLTMDQVFSFNGTTNRLYLLTKPLQPSMSNNLIAEFREGEWTAVNGTLTFDDVALPNGKVTGATLTDASGGTLAMSVHSTWETNWYVRGMYSFQLNIMAGTYTGNIALVMRDRAGTEIKRKVISPKSYWTTETMEGTAKDGHINDIVFSVETVDIPGAGETFFMSRPTTFRNNFYIIQGYKDIDQDEFGSIWDIQWIKDYTTQLFKRQWGENLKKYDQVQMVGGVTVNGQVIFDEADAKVTELEEKLELMYTVPPDMMWG